MRIHLPGLAQPALRHVFTPRGKRVAERLDVRRLLVLVPAEGLDCNGLARRLRSLAAPCELPVHLLCALGSNTGREPAMRLRLAALASAIGDSRIEVTSSIVSCHGWVGAVHSQWRPGDVVLCCAEQTVTTAVSGRRLLCQVMEAALKAPVFVLTGLVDETPCFSQSSY